MAITSVTQRAHRWNTPYSPAIFSCLSDENEQQDMFYVFDLYVNGSATRSHRIKQRPNPAGYGLVDISSIMATYINLANRQPNEALSKASPDPVDKNNFLSFAGSIAEVLVYVGEEHTVDNVSVLFDGSGVEGEPDYSLGNAENNSDPSAVEEALIFAPWAFTEAQSQLSLSQQTGLNITPWTTKYFPQDDPEYGYFMNEIPRNATWNTLNDLDQTTVTIKNFEDTVNNITQSILQLVVQQYDSTGSLLATNNLVNIQSNGGGPQTSTGYATIVPELEYYMLSCNITPGYAFTADPDWAYFTVKGEWKGTGSNFFTEPYYYYKDQECHNLYERVRLSWLNKWGGRDYYNFTQFFQKTTQTSSDTYSQSIQNWSGATSVVTNSEFIQAANYMRGGTKTFNRNTEVTFRVESDWVVQEELDYLGAIPESSQVLAYIRDKEYYDVSAGISDYDQEIPYTVQISNLAYEYKLIKQVKLTQVSFDMTYTKLDKKQDIV